MKKIIQNIKKHFAKLDKTEYALLYNFWSNKYGRK